MLDERQRETFAAAGLIRIEKLIPEATLAPARDLLLEVLETEGIWQDGAWLGDAVTEWSLGSRLDRRLKDRTKNAAAYASLVTPKVLEAVSDLVDGRGVQPMTERPALLFTPPNARRWTVPHKIWHLDMPRLGEVGLPGVQMFALLHAVPVGGGGTLVVAGSHRLLNDRGRVRSKDVKRRLKREPWFDELLSPSEEDERRRFLEEPGHVGDVELRVAELHGEAGDVFFTDLRLLHAPAPNASRVPRLMVTQRFVLESVLDQVGLEDARA